MIAAGPRSTMSPRARDAERTKTAILEAARRLFAEADFSAVSIRDIAEAAGVSHGLVQHHFGTREELIRAVVRDEIDAFAAAPAPRFTGDAGADLERLREELPRGMARFRDYARLVVRAELAGAEPEKLLDPEAPTPAQHLADAIRTLQRRAGADAGGLDPELVSAYVNSSLFAFATMAPWLMTSVGLEPRDHEARLDEIIDITVRLIALASGLPRERRTARASGTAKERRACPET
jgi:AcrR family transcriptional regulator